MKIFSIINRIKQELEESPRSKFGGGNKRVVEVDRLLDLLEDLKVVIPEDIRRANGIIAEADNTINDAKDQANDILDDAQKKALTEASRKAEAYFASESKKLDEQMVDTFRKNNVEVVTLTPAEFEAWRAVAQRTSYKSFSEKVPGGKELIEKALSVK